MDDEQLAAMHTAPLDEIEQLIAEMEDGDMRGTYPDLVDERDRRLGEMGG